MTDDKYLLFRSHPSAKGLDEAAAREIAEECEIFRLRGQEYLHRANEAFDSIYLLIHGRINQRLLDPQGKEIVNKTQTAGAQIGAMAAALGEPTPIEMIAVEPSTLLKLNYQKGLEFTKKHDVFRANISRQVAESTRSFLLKSQARKKSHRVAFFHQSPASRPLTNILMQRLASIGEKPFVLYDKEGVNFGAVPSRRVIDDHNELQEDEIRRQINECAESGRIVFDAQTDVGPDRSANVLEYCDAVYWCVSTDNWEDSLYYLNSLSERAPGWRDKISVIWLLKQDEWYSPRTDAFEKLAANHFKVSFDEPATNRSRELNNGITRIIHHLRGVKIGVALGGGAARGMAHLGVLKTLEENGIVVDMIAGTSAGAMTGITYGSGMEYSYNVGQFVNDLTPSWVFRKMPRGGHWFLLYKYRMGQFDPMLRKYLDDVCLEQLPIPVSSVTVDLISGNPVVRTRGDAVHAITESINLPVLSRPINRDGQALVDGGIVNNVPADVLVSQGCNFVIAVSVTAKMEYQFATNNPNTPTSSMRSASILQTILRTYLVQSVNMNSVGVAPADIVIEPDVSGFDVTEFTKAREMAEIGERATQQAIPEIRKYLARLDDKLFAEWATNAASG